MVVTEVVTMPGLLASLTGRSGEVVLAYREKVEEVVEKREVVSKPRTPPRRKESVDDLDLTGSPLSAGFDFNQSWENSSWQDGEPLVRSRSAPQYRGLGLREARTWLSRPQAESELWAQVEDKGMTLYLGSWAQEDTRSLSKVTWSGGPVSCRSLQQGQFQEVVKRHLGAGGHRGHKTEARAEFYLTTGEGSSLSVLSCWDKVVSLLETPPLDAMTCQLEARVVPGEDKLATTWAELGLLVGFVQGLTGSGAVTWVGDSGVSVEQRVLDLLETVRNSGPRSGVTRLQAAESILMVEGGDDSDPMTDSAVFNLETRQEVDFTDQLWLVLSKAQSYSELTSSLSLALSSIITEDLRPFLYGQARDGLEVVRLVKGLVRGELEATSLAMELSGPKPLSLLVECGLEKLRRDYSHILVTGELASKESVASFLAADSASQVVNQLLKLHRVVELAYLAQTFLSLPPDTLRSVVSSAMETERAGEGKIDQSPASYIFPLPGLAVAEQLARVRPSSWQVKLSSPGVVTVCRLVTERPVEVVGGEGAGGEDKEPEYYEFNLTEITRKTIKLQLHSGPNTPATLCNLKQEYHLKEERLSPLPPLHSGPNTPATLCNLKQE